MAAASLDEQKAKDVLRQVEFYFSDSNLPRDRFLREMVQQSEDGMVSLTIICAFKRMRSYIGLGDVKPEEVPGETVQAVAEALRKSTSLRVSEDGKKVGRITALSKPEEVIEQVDSRTIAVSPLPYDVKLEDVEMFFGKHGKVNCVRLPRHISDKRLFCGTALVEFSGEEDAKKMLDESLAYAGTELEIIPKKEFDVEREKKRQASGQNKGASNESYPKGLIVAFKLKKMEKANDTTEVTEPEIANSTANATEGDEQKSPMSSEDVDLKENVDKDGDPKDSTKEDANDSSQENEDVVNKLSAGDGDEIDASSGGKKNLVTREDLKLVFQRFGTVKFVDYRMGEESGYIRFDDPDVALKARAMSVLVEEGGLIVKKHIATLEALTGEEEKEYWSKLRGNQERYKENRGGSRGRGRGNKGGRHFDGKRVRPIDSTDTHRAKAQKV